MNQTSNTINLLHEKVAIDSNAFSFLIHSMSAGKKPDGDLEDQKIALLRIYLYRNEILYIVPTVESEYLAIKNESFKKLHSEIHLILLGDVIEIDTNLLELRISEYSGVHTGKKNKKDCQILAEAEVGGCRYMLTYDNKFISRLQNKTHSISIIRPKYFWELLNLPHGTKPLIKPHPTNPLFKQTWWIW